MLPAGLSAPVLALPTELLVDVAANLDSLSDVLAFAGACRRFQGVFQQNTFEISRSIISRSLECEDQAWALASVQEDVEVDDARGFKMTPRIVMRLARNAIKLNKTTVWFNKNEMKFVRPNNLETCLKVWGSAYRPSRLTESEKRRFGLAYYLAAAIMEDPKGIHNILDELPLRYVYYLFDMSKLGAPIGEEQPRPPCSKYTEKRQLFQAACKSRMEQLWSRFYPRRDLRYRNTLNNGPSFGCYGAHLVLYDHYQPQAQYELRPAASWAAYSDVNITPEDMKQFIWGEEISV